ncbi:3-oxoacyl-[acyl-carrier-protein] reductase FabG [Roseovarius sp. THAF9]|uniref:SDR family NAD(P)-dependent oxidoreductase n=1 Tax=Roseovarius sp. THAF9 TaxID=2587847 RepID=UPI00126972D4|nr:glucose 1-dehydrogenase [Roseovarius sp. THAF9]QFT93589.1 3-oxoacyl-[acyl-carrier-protein] reductase FabG [Roseovarius sp. THAF9]
MGLLDGKIAIITGAASPRGLGKATAQLFAEHGATVVVMDLDEAQAKAAASDVPGKGHIGVAGNVVDPEACKAVAQATLEAFGRIDILVNNAGITQPLKLMEIGPDNYDAVTDVNLRGTLYMSQAVIPTMRAQKAGSIVNMSSVSAQRGGGIFGGPHYSAAKAGVLGLTKAMARELAPDNVRANAICPGFIATDITAGKLTPEMRQMVLDGIPMGRAGEASDVAGCALFLASELSAYCTGTEVDVNGGSLIH